MKKFSKFLFSLIALSLLVLPMATMAAAGAPDATELGITAVENSNLNLAATNPINTATNLINTAMMFLGLIAVVIILVGGFKWMTAMGSEDSIKKAKALMTALFAARHPRAERPAEATPRPRRFRRSARGTRV